MIRMGFKSESRERLDALEARIRALEAAAPAPGKARK